MAAVDHLDGAAVGALYVSYDAGQAAGAVLIGWTMERLGTSFNLALGYRGGWALAGAVTGLTFGAMHMQPLGLPTLATLGIVLGFAYLRTGNLLTAILVHGLWNGGIFIAMRLLA